MRFNRHNINSTCRAAIEAARTSKRLQYVYATAFGYVVTEQEPKNLRQDFYIFGIERWTKAIWSPCNSQHIWAQPRIYDN